MNHTMEQLWRRQLAFTTELLATIERPLEQLTEDDKVRLTKDYLLSLHSEITEVLNNVPWKRHRFIGAADRDALLEELVDVQKFLWGLMMIWGVTPGELSRAFTRKSDIVEQRFKQDHLLPRQVTSDKVVIVDIDDVVANWEEGFESWVRLQHPELKDEDYWSSNDPGLRQRLKDEMHAAGGMKSLAVLDGTASAVNLLCQHGYTIVWLTARPIGRHPRLTGDTVTWLQSVGLPTAYIYYSDLNKHVFVVEKFPRAAALFDDKAETVAHAKEFGIMAFEVNAYGTAAGWSFLERVEEFLQVTSAGKTIDDSS